MKAVITGVAAIGLALTMPAFAQTPKNNPIGQYNQGSATAQKTAAKKTKKQTHAHAQK